MPEAIDGSAGREVGRSVTPDHIKQLIGGYATGTLTPGEQQALFQAALEDQDVFDALNHEQPLKDALESPAVRRELAAVLESKPSWWRMRWPVPVAAGAVALAALTVALMVNYNRPAPHPQEAKQMVQNRLPEPVEPAPAPIEKRKPARKQKPEPRVQEPARVAAPIQDSIVEPPAVAAAPSMARGMRGGVVGGVVGGFTASPAKSEMLALTATPLGLRYSISAGRLVVESDTDAVLYLFRRQGPADWIPVTPGGLTLKAHAAATTPPVAGDALLILSPTLLPQLAQTGPALNATIGRIREVNEAPLSPGQAIAGSTYLVSPRAAAGAVLVAPLVLP